jgi:hypothetical protein
VHPVADAFGKRELYLPDLSTLANFERIFLHLMLRKSLIALLAFLYVFSTNRAVVPLVNYVVNHDYYVENCENKEKPELECDGCCQVKKQIADEHTDTSNQATPEQHHSSSSSTNTNELSEIFHLVPSALNLAAQMTGLYCYTSFSTSSILTGFYTLPFQPPRC